MIIEQLNFFMDTIKGETKVKERESKFNPKNGIYMDDKELTKTVFKPNVKFKYGIDTKKKILKLMPSDTDEGTQVAKRERRGEISSVIHIRRKQILDLFKDVSKLEFEIFEECIIIKSADENKKKVECALTIEEVESLADKTVDENIRRQVAIHTKKHPILQKIYDVVREPLRVVSLFSGIGTMDYSFQMEGFKTEWCCEIDKDASDALRKNIPEAKVYNKDINDINFDEMPKADVVIGGSPCQEFSVLNSKRVWDAPKNKLVYKFIEAVKKLKAKVFLLENVPQLITVKAQHYLNAIKEAFPEFKLSVGVLNSAEFGSAQSRDRAYILGSRIGEIDLPKGDKSNKKTVREAFEGITENTPNAKDFSIPTEKTLERMKYVPQGGNWQNIPEEIRTKSKFSNSFRRLAWDGQSPTLVNLGRTIMMHPEENRILSVREQARLFGIPDSFSFCGKLFSKQQQVANTVVVDVIRAIARKIKQKFDQLYDEKIMKRFSLTYL